MSGVRRYLTINQVLTAGWRPPDHRDQTLGLVQRFDHVMIVSLFALYRATPDDNGSFTVQKVCEL